MKLIRGAAMLMVATMIFSACDKDDAQPDTQFSFTFNGKEYVSHATTAFLTDTVVAGQRVLVVDGLTNNFQEHMQLMIISPDSTLTMGTYSGSTMSLMPVQDSLSAGYLGTNMTVEITSINSTRAEGTFSGTLTESGENEKPLTDGTFKVNIN
ncbi:hypothetical protein [Chitinophaga japonensis]|uniref:Uncharacterized protein n=1 Tax=Chitinophaga japonensis TaxID=104662 RepID=A0A562TCR8_CHIJA|nr:hypothetical protein [Chitinophaga japonensis]TWI91357.1 hypothetical protein LX66_0726 [Chitinophaga japonensis]